MSNHLAVATVTAAIQQILQESLPPSLPGAVVTTRRLDELAAAGTKQGINVYLFQATLNAAFRNDDLPLRAPDGSLVHAGYVPLDLHYIVTFYGQEERHEPEQLFAAATVALARSPALTPERLAHAVERAIEGSLADSDLPFQPERVRIDLATLDREELHRLWAIFSPTPYRLSSVYRVSVVLLDLEPSSAPPPPVLRVGVERKAMPPEIADIAPRRIPAGAGAFFRVRTGAPVDTKVYVDEIPAQAEADPDGRGWLRVFLPEGCRAGARTVRLEGGVGSSVLVLPVLQGPVALRGPQNDVVACVLPLPAVGQKAELILDGSGGEAGASAPPWRFLVPKEFLPDPWTDGGPVPPLLATAFKQNGHPLSDAARLVFEEEARVKDGARRYAVRPDVAGNGLAIFPGLVATDGAGVCVFRFPNLRAGEYRARVRVDGADSPPTGAQEVTKL